MKHALRYCGQIALVLFLTVLVACSTKTSEDKSDKNGDSPDQPTDGSVEQSNSENTEGEVYRTWDTVAYETLRANLPPFDLNQDLSKKSLEELRILRNTVPARYGYLFMNADLRYYFYSQPWYKPLMEARWYGDCEYSGLRKAPPIEYTVAENAFIQKVQNLEQEKRKQNFIVRDGRRYANVKNIVNAWQFHGLPDKLMAGLDRNGFAIVPGSNVQLFHVYEENDYSQTQNFVTTDLYLQLFHMHFSFMLRGLEENNFSEILKALSYGMVTESQKLANSNGNAAVKDAAEYAAAFYSIPHSILTDENALMSGNRYEQAVSQEMNKIDALTSTTSALLPAYSTYDFPYDLFTPRGHYTRNDTLKRYFQAMQWIQTAPFCLDDNTDLARAFTMAHVLLNGRSSNGKALADVYASLLEPISFLVGEPDNLSIMDVCNVVKAKGIKDINALLAGANIASIREELQRMARDRGVIVPKQQNTCPQKINFMPSRFVFDGEVLGKLADPKERPFPKGLDVFAAMGNKAAEDVLMQEEKNNSWKEFLPTLREMKNKYSNYEAWDQSVYTKWISSLSALLEPDNRYPSFMQLPSWNKKNLNTALASWAELKHDAILYAKQPMAAECGGGEDCSPPPEPFVIGYVEPNIRYWEQALELLDQTENLMTNYGLFEDFKFKHAQLKEMCQFLLATTEKELRGEKLTEQEYNTIERIGSSVEYITLSIFGTDNWDYVSGADKQIAVVADVYTNNVGNKAGILHAAVGYANDIYVLVEIEGYLYLLKGATFSYYEFPQPLNKRLTDEEWQEKLKNGDAPELPAWIKDVIIDLNDQVKPQVKEFLYSSGC